MPSNEIEYGCLMMYVNIPNWNRITKSIDSKHILEDGLELNPHITILYGIDLSDGSKNESIKKYIELLDIRKFNVELTGISYFDNAEYDVLKFDVKSDILYKLHNLTKSIFPYIKIYDNYTPHLTIAYLEKKTGEHYKMNFKNPIIVKPSMFVYSESEYEHGNISMKIKD